MALAVPLISSLCTPSETVSFLAESVLLESDMVRLSPVSATSEGGLGVALAVPLISSLGTTVSSLSESVLLAVLPRPPSELCT